MMPFLNLYALSGIPHPGMGQFHPVQGGPMLPGGGNMMPPSYGGGGMWGGHPLMGGPMQPPMQGPPQMWGGQPPMGGPMPVRGGPMMPGSPFGSLGDLGGNPGMPGGMNQMRFPMRSMY